MCIIAIKPVGVKRPTKDQLEAMCTANPDGFGYMTWSKKKGLQVRKTMNEEQFLKWVQKIPDTQPVVYHARIATHGSVNVRNCHPFLSDDKQWAFAHNGILRIQNERDMTDSETFFRRIAMPMLRAGYHPNDKGDFDAMVNTIIDGSKFAFMDGNGNIYTMATTSRTTDCCSPMGHISLSSNAGDGATTRSSMTGGRQMTCLRTIRTAMPSSPTSWNGWRRIWKTTLKYGKRVRRNSTTSTKPTTLYRGTTL